MLPPIRSIIYCEISVFSEFRPDGLRSPDNMWDQHWISQWVPIIHSCKCYLSRLLCCWAWNKRDTDSLKSLKTNFGFVQLNSYLQFQFSVNLKDMCCFGSFKEAPFLPSVCWVWEQCDWHNKLDIHLRLDHLGENKQRPYQADSLSCQLQVSKCTFGNHESVQTWSYCYNHITGLPPTVSSTSQGSQTRSTATILARCLGAWTTTTASEWR